MRGWKPRGPLEKPGARPGQGEKALPALRTESLRLREGYVMGATFQIVHGKFDGRLVKGIKCLVCGRTSWNQNDVKNEYCGGCHQYHDIMSKAGWRWERMRE